jgi:multiple sugar transport system permease protein
MLQRLAESAFVWPLVVLVGIFMVVPIGIAVVHSFDNWNPGYSTSFIGLSNYSTAFHSPIVRQIAGNELIYLIGVPLWAGCPLIIAVLLYDRVPAAGVFRTIFFFPSVLSPAVIGIVFEALLAPDGIVNTTLQRIGLGFLARAWIDSALLVKPSIITIVLWFSLGVGVLIYSAGLSAVPTDLFEAAQVDGATWWQRLRYVMIPAIRPLVVLNIVLNLGAVAMLFGYIFVLTQGGPGYSSASIDWNIYETAINYGEFGLAAAESVLVLVALALIVVVGFRIARRLQAPRLVEP